jgi:hypothetical protein
MNIPNFASLHQPMRASRCSFVSPGTEETGWFGSAAGGGVGITVGVVALGSEFVALTAGTFVPAVARQVPRRRDARSWRVIMEVNGGWLLSWVKQDVGKKDIFRT